MPKQWFYISNGSQYGPVSSQQLLALCKNGTVAPSDMLWTEGLVDWKAAGELPKLFPAGKTTAPPPAGAASTAPPPLAVRVAAAQPQADTVAPTTAMPAPVASKLGGMFGKIKDKAQAAMKQATSAGTGTTSAKSGVSRFIAGAKEKIQPRTSSSPGDPATPAGQQGPSSAELLVQAKEYFSERRYGQAEAILIQVSQVSVATEEIQDLTSEVQATISARAFYAGGHPTALDAAEGVLRFDKLGIEFIPDDPTRNAYLRVDYDQIASVLEPRRGSVPPSFQNKMARRKTAGSAMKMLGNFGAGFLDNRVARSVAKGTAKAAGGAISDSGNISGKPDNRVRVRAKIDGTAYKLSFDTCGDSPELMEQSALALYQQCIPIQSLFGAMRKPTATAAASESTADSPDTPTAPLAASKAVVVGCGKCEAKLRAKAPGIVQCPKCGAKIRVREEMFNG
jgi:hypothetical protein